MVTGYCWNTELRGTLVAIRPDGRGVFVSGSEDEFIMLTGSLVMLRSMQCSGEIDVELEMSDALPHATVKRWWTLSNEDPVRAWRRWFDGAVIDRVIDLVVDDDDCAAAEGDVIEDSESYWAGMLEFMRRSEVLPEPEVDVHLKDDE